MDTSLTTTQIEKDIFHDIKSYYIFKGPEVGAHIYCTLKPNVVTVQISIPFNGNYKKDTFELVLDDMLWCYHTDDFLESKLKESVERAMK